MSYPTSRRYPRTTKEAWPKDYAESVEIYLDQSFTAKVVRWFLRLFRR